MQMANNKTPDNIIQFPKKYRRPTTPEQDKVMADRIKKEHQKIYCQAMCDEITENILIKLHSENIKVTEKNFLKDYKLVSEALKSMMLRTQGITLNTYHSLHQVPKVVTVTFRNLRLR